VAGRGGMGADPARHPRDRLAHELLTVAEETMQPTQASLWLRLPAPSTAVDGPAHGRLAAVE
jgi:hypothetical protein